MLSIVATAVLLLAPDGGDPPGVDPLPLHRIIVPANRVAMELERVRQGVLVQLSRAAFEALVRQAAGALERGKNPPRLVQAAYRARLVGSALVGSGDWTVVNPAGAPGICPISALNLALRRVKVGAKDAVIGDLDGKTLGLFLEPEWWDGFQIRPTARGSETHQPGKEQTVSFDWTLRGGQEAGGVHFDLQIPPCPIASLDLTLPADATVNVSRSVAVLSGPHEAGASGQRLWRLRFSDRSSVDLIIHYSHDHARPAPLTVSHLTTVQRLTPALLRADFDFQVEILHRPITRLVLDVDPMLEPFDVSLRNIDIREWKLVPPEVTEQRSEKGLPPQPHRRLIVDLREAFLGTLPSLRVRCLARLPTDSPPSPFPLPPASGGEGKVRGADRPWSSPWMRLRDAAVQGETLKLEILPDVRLENWQPGGFRLVGAATAPDGSQTLTLVGTESNQAASRPTAQVRTEGVDFLARQRTWWQVGPQGSSLTAEITYEVSRGSLIELPVILPSGWQVNDVTIEPKELLRNWFPVSAGGRSTVVVDLQRGLTPRQQARLIIRLHSSQRRALSEGAASFDFPDLAPQDPCVRESTLAISVDPLLEGTVLRASLPVSVADAAGPWGSTTPTFCFNSRNQPVSGTLRVVRRPPKIQATCRSQFVLTPGSTGMSLRLDLEARSGTARTIDVLLSAPLPDGVTWKCVSRPDSLRGVQRVFTWDPAQVLLAIGQSQGLAVASTLALSPPHERWRLSFNSPLKSRETFLLEGTWVPPVGHLPFVTVPGAASFDGEVNLYLVGTEVSELTALGLKDTMPGGRGQGPGLAAKKSSSPEDPSTQVPSSPATPWRTYRYDNPSPFTRSAMLSVRTKGLPPDRGAQEFCDHARLLTEMRPGGRLVHSFSFGLWNWRRRIVPVRLPAGAALLAARVDGCWIDRLAPVAVSDAVEVGLPVTSGNGLHRLEIVYETSHEWPTWAIGTSLVDPRPQLPVSPVSFRQAWRLPPGIIAVTDRNLRRVPSLRYVPETVSWREMPGAVWGTGSTALAELAGLPTEPEWLARQHQVLEAAETALRQEARAGEPWSLGSAFERLALSLSKEATVLVLDTTALQSGRLSPQTRFVMPSTFAGGGAWHPFWESLGLVYVPCRGGVLLTTRAQMNGRQVAGVGAETFSATLEAVHDAGADGHDPSGRFQSAWDWAASSPGPPISVSWHPLIEDFTDSYSYQGSEWESVTGDIAMPVSVVREEAISVLGLILAGLLALLAWSLPRVLSARWRFLLLVAWLATAVLAVLWLPPSLHAAVWGPATVGFVTALWWYARAVWRQQATRQPDLVESSAASQPLTGTMTTSIGALLVLSVVLGSLPRAHCQQQETYPVLLVPMADSDQEMALVDPDLLDRLRKISERAVPGAREVVPIRALYDGKVSQDRADFKAEFQLYSFAERSTLSLPLTGIELKEGALLDGVDANPALLPGPQGGYGIPIVGCGPHTLSVAFTCRIAEAREQVNLAFGVPRLPQSHVVVTLPAGSEAVSVLTALGLQNVTAAEKGQVRVEADLGREDNVHLRWQTPSRSSRSTAVQVRETYLWDFRQPVPSLTAVLNYTPVGGALRHFALQLPDNMVVRSVEARQAGAAPESISPPRLKGWRVLADKKPSRSSAQGADRLLQVDLQTPYASPVQLTLGLIPRLSTGASPLLLTLPAPQDVLLTEGFVAYRVKDWEALDKVNHLGVTNLPSQAFLQVWTAAGMPDPGLPTRAYTFRRTPGGLPALQLSLQEPRLQATQELGWYVQAGYADVRAQAELVSTHEDIMLIEWTVPSELTVADVRGPDVDHWSRSDDRVQAWLRAARQTTRLELSGWVPWTPGSNSPQAHVALPAVHLATGKISEALVRIASAPGLTMEPAQLQNLTPVPVQGPMQLCYLAKPPAYRAVLNIRPAPSGAIGETPGSSQKKSLQPLAPASLVPAAVQVLNCEQQAALGDDRRWVHQAVYLMTGESSVVRLDLPAGARLRGAVLDGKALSPGQPTPQSLLIRLSENAEPHRLAVRWSFDNGLQPIDNPNLASPHFEGFITPPAIWMVSVPPFADVKSKGDEYGRTDCAELELHRAETMMKLGNFLAQGKDSGTAANQARIRGAQQVFFAHLRRVDYELSLAAARHAGQTAIRAQLRARMQELRDQNVRWARQQNLDKIRIEAEQRPEHEAIHVGDAFFALAAQGTPTYWRPGAGGQAPRLRLTMRPDHDVRHKAMVTAFLVLFVAGVVLLGHFPRIVSWICSFWPEQLMIVAVLGCQAFGLSPLGVVLFLSGAFFRLMWMANAIHRRFTVSPGRR